MTIVPHWDGHYSTTCIGYRGKTPILRYAINKDFPLCFVRADGIRYRPEMVFSSDCGSIPDLVQRMWIPGCSLKRDQFPKSYGLHDSGCANGGHWVFNPIAGTWHFTELDRGTIDIILKESLAAEGANRVECALIYFGVRVGSMFPRKVVNTAKSNKVRMNLTINQ